MLRVRGYYAFILGFSVDQKCIEGYHNACGRIYKLIKCTGEGYSVHQGGTMMRVKEMVHLQIFRQCRFNPIPIVLF